MSFRFDRGELYSIINAVAAAAIARKMQKRFKEEGLEITLEQWSILYHLWKKDGFSQQELAEKTFKNKTSITRLIDNLEKLGLVVRKNDKEDKRMRKIFLTAKGKGIEKKTILIANETMETALINVQEEEIIIVKNVLQKVYENIR